MSTHREIICRVPDYETKYDAYTVDKGGNVLVAPNIIVSAMPGEIIAIPKMGAINGKFAVYVIKDGEFWESRHAIHYVNTYNIPKGAMIVLTVWGIYELFDGYIAICTDSGNFYFDGISKITKDEDSIVFDVKSAHTRQCGKYYLSVSGERGVLIDAYSNLPFRRSYLNIMEIPVYSKKIKWSGLWSELISMDYRKYYKFQQSGPLIFPGALKPEKIHIFEDIAVVTARNQVHAFKII